MWDACISLIRYCRRYILESTHPTCPSAKLGGSASICFSSLCPFSLFLSFFFICIPFLLFFALFLFFSPTAFCLPTSDLLADLTGAVAAYSETFEHKNGEFGNSRDTYDGLKLGPLISFEISWEYHPSVLSSIIIAFFSFKTACTSDWRPILDVAANRLKGAGFSEHELRHCRPTHSF